MKMKHQKILLNDDFKSFLIPSIIITPISFGQIHVK